MKFSYKYETHAHTSESSTCAKITAKELVRFYKTHGFSGLCVTDHFLNGNTTAPKNLPWADRIQFLCKGYENACVEGRKAGLDVFFGWEYTYKATDFLTYGLDKEWLLNHPDLLDMSLEEYCDLVHRDNGFIVHAHPFRDGHISMIILLPQKVDAVEVINGSKPDFENNCANQYADNYNLLKIAGTDTHTNRPKKVCGIRVEKRLNSVKDMITAIKAGDFDIFEDTGL